MAIYSFCEQRRIQVKNKLVTNSRIKHDYNCFSSRPRTSQAREADFNIDPAIRSQNHLIRYFFLQSFICLYIEFS